MATNGVPEWDSIGRGSRPLTALNPGPARSVEDASTLGRSSGAIAAGAVVLQLRAKSPAARGDREADDQAESA